MGLKEYVKKRNFKETSEPKSGTNKDKGTLRFVVQRHHASHLHYDFRLELEGVLKSWAVPKGPSLNPKDKRLAMMVEDHPYSYRTFEGTIPEGNYGAGVVTIFDEGTYEAISGGSDEKELKKGLYSGNLKFKLHGKILKGEFALVKIKDNEENSWLLIKHRDEYAVDQKFDSESLVPEAVKREGIERKKKSRRAKALAETEPERPTYSFQPVSPAPAGFVPQGNNWLFEEKLTGHRVLARTGKDGWLLDEDQLDISDRYPALAETLRGVRDTAVIDGVITQANTKSPVLHAFDMIELNEHDISTLELNKRKDLLNAFLKGIKSSRVVYHSHVQGSIESALPQLRKEKWKAMIIKDVSAVYGEPADASVWKEITATKMKDQKADVQDAPPATSKKKKAGNSGTPDRKADEKEEKFGKKTVKLTHLDKLYWKKEKISKGELLDYYREVAPYLLPYLKDRPLSLNRHPNGIDAPGFFQKDLDVEQIPSWIKYAPLYSESNDKNIDYLICNDLPTLLWMVNLGCIEINPWLSTYKKTDKPVFAVMDLDPNDVDDFNQVVQVALTARDMLQQMNIRPYIKTSGSRGLHIFMHLGAKYEYEVVKNFVHYLGQIINQQHPETTSLERSPSKRKKKIYLDFLQNRRGQTIAAPYSCRPKPGATVSTPLEWNEVNGDLDIRKYTIFNTMERLKEKGDLWKDITSEKTDLKKALEKLASL